MKILSFLLVINFILLWSLELIASKNEKLKNSYERKSEQIFCETEKFSFLSNLNQFDYYGSEYEDKFKGLSEKAYIRITDKLTMTSSLHKNMTVSHDGVGNFTYEAFFYDEQKKLWIKSFKLLS